MNTNAFVTLLATLLIGVQHGRVSHLSGSGSRRREIGGLPPGPVFTVLNSSLALVFLARAIGNRTVGFFKNVHRTRYARLDSIVYSPICLFLGAAIFSIGLARPAPKTTHTH